MNDQIVMQGDYVDLRFIKGRKCMQVVVEFPIEAGGAWVAGFGVPSPATGVPVAIARLATAQHQPERHKGGPLARRAGILCNEPKFREFLGEMFPLELYENSKELTTAEIVRDYCDVNSRAELDNGNQDAAKKFFELEMRYNIWLEQPHNPTPPPPQEY